jgi:hypothetical protein
MRANNQEILEGSLQKSYQKNPNNADIAEQYAYSLLKNNSNFSYTDSAKQAEVIIDGVLNNPTTGGSPSTASPLLNCSSASMNRRLLISPNFRTF